MKLAIVNALLAFALVPSLASISAHASEDSGPERTVIWECSGQVNRSSGAVRVKALVTEIDGTLQMEFGVPFRGWQIWVRESSDGLTYSNLIQATRLAIEPEANADGIHLASLSGTDILLHTGRISAPLGCVRAKK